MKAILFDNYGDSSVMYCGEIEKPEINQKTLNKQTSKNLLIEINSFTSITMTPALNDRIPKPSPKARVFQPSA